MERRRGLLVRRGARGTAAHTAGPGRDLPDTPAAAVIWRGDRGREGAEATRPHGGAWYGIVGLDRETNRAGIPGPCPRGGRAGGLSVGRGLAVPAQSSEGGQRQGHAPGEGHLLQAQVLKTLGRTGGDVWKNTIRSDRL